MEVYIVGIHKNIVNKRQIDFYTLCDIDDKGKIRVVDKLALKSVLEQCKLKLHNAKYQSGVIKGTYYPISSLDTLGENKVLVLKVINSHKYIVLRKKNEAYITTEISKADINKLLAANAVFNVGENGVLLCKKIQTSEPIINTPINKVQTSGVKVNTRDLDKEAYDKNKVWTIDDFKTFMANHGWTYELEQCFGYPDDTYELSKIDSRCTVVHMPTGVFRSSCMFNDIPKNLHTIIFCDGFTFTNVLYPTASTPDNMDTFSNVTNIYFQDTTVTKEFVGSALQRLIISGTAELPKRQLITHVYNRCTIKNLELCGNTCETLSVSLNNCKIGNSVLNFDIERIDNCLNECKGNIALEFDKHVLEIRESFCNSGISSVSFDKTEYLTNIGSSFGKLNITKVDLSMCTSIKNLRRMAFCDCKRLSDIRLPKGLKIISNKCFYDCICEKVDLPYGLSSIEHPICGKNTKLVLNNLENVLRAELLIHYDWKERNNLVIPNSITKAEGHGLFSSISIPLEETGLTHLDDIGFRPFEHSVLPVFDSDIFPKITSITAGWFEYSYSLETVIFRNNITYIAENALVSCRGLKHVIFDDQVKEFKATLFKDVESSRIVKAYVVKNSPAHKKLAKNSNIVVIVVDSVNEALELINNKEETPEAKRAKFEVMLNGSEYEELLQDEHIENVQYLYMLLSRLKDNVESPDCRITLDESKFKRIPLDTIPELRNFSDKIINGLVNSTERYTPSIKELDDRFIALCNLFTNLYDLDNHCYTDDFLNYINGVGNADVTNSFYSDEKAIIVAFRFSALDITYSYGNVLAIIIKNQIVFMTPFDMNSARKSRLIRLGYSIVQNTYNNAHSYQSLIDEFLPGDCITSMFGSNSTIHGVDIPRKFSQLIFKTFTDTTRFIGYAGGENIIDRAEKSRKDMIINVLFYDIYTSKFIEGSAILKYDQGRIVGFNNLVIKNIMDFNAIGSLNREYFRDLLDTPQYEKMCNMVRIASMTDDEVNNVYNNADNYDAMMNTEMTAIAEEVYRSGCKDAAELSHDLVRKILASNWFEDAGISLNKVNKMKDNKCKVIQLNPNNKAIVTFKPSDRYLNVTGLISPDTSLTSTKILRQSILSIDMITRVLYLIGDKRINSNELPKCSIDNKPVDIDNYITLTTVYPYTSKASIDGITYVAAVDRVNGDPYLLTSAWDTEYYALFRFKSVIDMTRFIVNALDDIPDNLNESEEKRQFRSNLYDLALSLINHEDIKNSNYLNYMRNRITDGIPNNFPYTGEHIEIFRTLAKQLK